MTASSSVSQWIYTWIVSGTSVTSTTATVSGTDLAGNYLSGSDSITFTIDNNPFQISGSEISANNLTVSLTFSEDVFTQINSGSGTSTLQTTDFSLSLSGNSGMSLSSSTPSSISGSGTLYNLGIPSSGYATGTETLTIIISNDSIFDIVGNTATITHDIGLHQSVNREYAATAAVITGSTVAIVENHDNQVDVAVEQFRKILGK